MKRSTLLKRLLPRNRKVKLVPKDRLNGEVVAKARELSKVTQRVETARRVERETIQHVRDLKKEEETTGKVIKDALSAFDGQVGRSINKVREKEGEENRLDTRLATKRKKEKELKALETAIARDKEAADVAMDKRKAAEAAQSDSNKKMRIAEAVLSDLEKKNVALQKSMAEREKAVSTLEKQSRDRDSALRSTAKRLKVYGNRLKDIYKEKGIPLPESIINIINSI